MANIKFSDFTGGASIVQADHFLVGFDTDATAGGSNPKNNKWSFSQVADGLIGVTAKPYSIYSANGTITTGRKALLAGTLQFRNAGDSSDIFKLNTDGTFTLGDGATHSNSAPNTSIVIGTSALVTSNNSVVIGASATTGFGGDHNVLLGADTSVANNTNFGIAIGRYAASNTNGIAIGYSSAVGGNGIAIGRDAEATANPSITLNASGSTATNSTANSFSVYMTSNTTPDFEVLGGGESTLNTSLKITGQGYTEQHGTPLAGTTIDWNNGNIQYIQLASGANTLSLSNPKSGATYILQVKQPSSGAAGTITYPTSVKYPGGSKPTLTTDNDAVDIITLIYNGTTTHYYANATLDLK